MPVGYNAAERRILLVLFVSHLAGIIAAIVSKGKEHCMAKKALKIVGGIVIALVVVVAGYLAYMLATYSRIPDGQVLDVGNNQSAKLECGKKYTALTYNIGFGAYTPEYSFFMDEGVMDDGTKTQGTSSWAKSKESVENCTSGDIALVKEQDVDFALLQEVDFGSTRSYNVNQVQLIEDAFSDMGSVEAVDYHSSFLFYPFTQPHGFANSSLLTLSSANVDSAVRRSYPVSDSLSKFTDLDRCFSVSRIPVKGGRELVLVNSHMSAYDKGGIVREQQLKMICEFLTEEASKGNYVIMGGDFNHALFGSEKLYPSKQQVPSWIAVFDDKDLPKGYSLVKPTNLKDVATCRGADIPYEKGVNYTSTIDGFIVSSNVKATSQNIDNGFKYSDHNPVKLTFELEE